MSKSRQKGTYFRRLIRDYCRGYKPWRECEAAPEWGAADEGDLLNTYPFIFELKNEDRYDFGGWLKEAVTEAHNASKRRKQALIPAVIHHPKGKGKAEDAGVYLRLEDLVGLLRLLT